MEAERAEPARDDPPALRALVRTTVVIPARDEAASIGRSLEAIAGQRTLAGGPLDPRTYETIVLANNCSDATAAIARAFGRAHPALTLHVCERTFSGETAHVGTARRWLMDAAAGRFFAAGDPEGVIVSTDADTVVDPSWLAWTHAEIDGADAVTGRILIDAAARAAFAPATRALYLREAAYHHLVAELEALLDPVADDPAPRHAQHFGASFAVRARAYRAAGGLPALPYLEDLALYHGLKRIDARVRHSPFVRVWTSARLRARVVGGLATRLTDIERGGERAGDWLVEHPDETLARIAGRAAFRRWWSNAARPGDRALIGATFALDPVDRAQLLAASQPFGATFERAERLAAERDAWSRYPRVPIGFALGALRVARALMRSRIASSART